MTDSLKFGPEWLRNMSADVTTSTTTTTLNNSSGMRYPLAEFRYGREEMLSLFDKTNVRVPDILPNFKKLFIDKVQSPLALTPSTEDDMRLWTRPIGITSGAGGGGGISTRGTSRGGSIDRGRGRGRGTFHPSITHQRSTSLFDDDSRGTGTARSSERVWPERNGGGTNNLINNNALVNELIDWSSSSGGGSSCGIGNSMISSPRKEFSGHTRLTNDNWRRTRLEDDMVTTDGWRSASTTSLTRQTSEKWGRSTSWRDDESSQNFEKSSQSDKSKDYSEDLNDDLPEWATEDPHEGGGSFDSTGAFHGSDDELQIQHHIQKMYRDDHHLNKDVSGVDRPDLPDTTNGVEPISTKPEENIIPPVSESSTNDSSLLNQSTNSVDRMQKVADDMVEKLIMDDESNSNMSSLHVMQVVEDDLKKIIMTDDLNQGMPMMNDGKSNMQQNLESIRRGPVEPSKLLKSEENMIVAAQMAQMPTILPSHIPTPVAVIGSDLWFYHDPQGNIQGPFTATEMAEWYRAGYFDENLYLRRQCDARFSSLGELVEMCNGAIPFLASHLLPPVGFPIVHPKVVDPLPSQPQQQPDASISRHSPGIVTPTKLPGNIMDINYLLQKQQYIMRHQHHAAATNHIVQKLNMEPWNLLPSDQRNKMLEQIAVSQIATPYHSDPLLQQHQQRQKQQPQNIPPQLKSSSGKQHFVQFDHTAAVTNDPIHQYMMSQPQLLQRSASTPGQSQNDILVENDPINNLIMQLSIQKNSNEGVSNSLPPPATHDDDRTPSPWLENSAVRLNPMIGGNSGGGSNNTTKMNMIQQVQQSQNQKSQMISNMLIGNLDLEQQNMHQAPQQSNHSHGDIIQHSNWNNNGPVVTAVSSISNKKSIWERLPDGGGNQMLLHQSTTKSMQQHIEASNSLTSGMNDVQNVYAAPPSNNSIKSPETESYHYHHQNNQSNISLTENHNMSTTPQEIDEVSNDLKHDFTKFVGSKKEEKPKKSESIVNPPTKKDYKKSTSNDDFIMEKGKKSKKDKSVSNNPPSSTNDDLLINNSGNTTISTTNKNSNSKKMTNEKLPSTGSNNNKSNNSNDRGQTNSNSITKSVAPWSFAATPAATSQSPSLAEIQKSEMERRAEQYRYEQILREQQQQTMMGIAKSNTNATFMWSGRNVLPKNIKSLAEIQAEEHAKQQEQYNNNSGILVASSVASQGTGGSNPLNYSRSNTSLNLNTNKINKTDESGKVTFSALLNNNNWPSSSNSGVSRHSTSSNTANNTNLSVFGKFLLNYSSQGIWEEQTTKKSKQNLTNSTSNSVVQSHQNISQTQSPNQQAQQSKMILHKSQTVANMPQTNTKSLQNNSHNLIGGGDGLNINNNNKNSCVHQLNQSGHKSSMDNDVASKISSSVSIQSKKDNRKELQTLGSGSNSNEFINWCIKALSNLTNTVDVPTFATFLQDIESPYEVKDYIKGYLGESRECCEFAKQFLERRSKYKNQQRAQNAHIDDMCQPAPAINPGTNDFQEIKGKGKKVKKNKMTKLDSRILGFSVTAAQDRINVGDRDYGDAS